MKTVNIFIFKIKLDSTLIQFLVIFNHQAFTILLPKILDISIIFSLCSYYITFRNIYYKITGCGKKGYTFQTKI